MATWSNTPPRLPSPAYSSSTPARNGASSRLSRAGPSCGRRTGPGAPGRLGLLSSMMVPVTAQEPSISVVPASHATCDDLKAVFGTRGAASWCQCQRYKLRPREAFRSFPVEERVRRLHEQTDCGHPESDTTSGLVAYLDGEPVGWCAVEPRPEYEGLLRVFRVPWD